MQAGRLRSQLPLAVLRGIPDRVGLNRGVVMATWQFDIDLIPRSKLMALYGLVPTNASVRRLIQLNREPLAVAWVGTVNGIDIVNFQLSLLVDRNNPSYR